MQPLISVIIPVYNVEKYVRKCIGSVIKQSYENLEIILVDDGSTDKSGGICDEYAKKDKRIKVIHKENGGLSDARNVGIDICKGEYITFVDSDDWVPDDSVSVLYDLVSKYDGDISSGVLKEVFRRSLNGGSSRSSIVVYEKEDALKELMYLHGLSNSASGKLYKKELFNKIKYPVGKHYEDLGTTYKIFALANRVVLSDDVVYYYYQNSESIVHSRFSEKRIDGVKFALEEFDFIRDMFPKAIDAARFRLVYECLSCLNDMPVRHRRRRKIYSYIRRYRKEVLEDKMLYGRQRMLIYASFFGQIGIKIAFWVRNKRKMRSK